jgi:hypothetical protein
VLDASHFDQGAFRMNMVDVRTSVVRDFDSHSSSSVMPALAELSSADILNHFPCDSTLFENIPFEIPVPSPMWPVVDNGLNCVETADREWIQGVWTAEPASYDWRFGRVEPQPFTAVSVECSPHDVYSNLLLPSVDWVVAPSGEVVVLGTMDAESGFSHELAHAFSTLVTYVDESQRRARDLLKRIRRKSILSSCVSKNGHVPFLASESRVRVETTARDQVVHLEVISLAEEHEEAPDSSALSQILMFGEGLCKRMKQSSCNLFSGCLERALYFGSIGVGPSAVAA